jgi:juvenile hormone epoxide hydrolase
VDESVRPFKINIDDKVSSIFKFKFTSSAITTFLPQVLEDLKTRLNLNTRFQAPLEGTGFEYGFNTDFLQQIRDYWLNKYNWRKEEAELNKYPNYKTNIMGLDMHFQRIKPSKELAKNRRVVPLLMLHGWPSSFAEFRKMIPLLASQHEGFVFDIIIPSLPGYAFSSPAAKPGLGATEMTVVMVKLMQRLGFEKFYAHGGDWGSMIVDNLATIFPEQ